MRYTIARRLDLRSSAGLSPPHLSQWALPVPLTASQFPMLPRHFPEGQRSSSRLARESPASSQGASAPPSQHQPRPRAVSPKPKEATSISTPRRPRAAPWAATCQPGPSSSTVPPNSSTSRTRHTTSHTRWPPLLPAYVSHGKRETDRPSHVSASSAGLRHPESWRLPRGSHPPVLSLRPSRQQFDSTLVK